MNTPRFVCLAALISSAWFTGCAVSPDYSHYDWHARGGIVEEQDRSLASARFEPFQTRRQVVAVDEQIIPSGAPPSETRELVIDPDRRADVVVQRPARTVAVRTTSTP